MWTARFGRGFGPAVRKTAKLMNEFTCAKITGVYIISFIRKANGETIP
jgi:hypothetical protein